MLFDNLPCAIDTIFIHLIHCIFLYLHSYPYMLHRTWYNWVGNSSQTTSQVIISEAELFVLVLLLKNMFEVLIDGKHHRITGSKANQREQRTLPETCDPLIFDNVKECLGEGSLQTLRLDSHFANIEGLADANVRNSGDIPGNQIFPENWLSLVWGRRLRFSSHLILLNWKNGIKFWRIN